jgi:LysR family hydrogen peroxide-inducible transcriptional activator
MNIQQLEYIVAVDRLKSFSKAADFCNVTQATLSAMVKKLEEELDVVLFERKSQPLVTTEAGKAVLAEAQPALQHIEKLKFLAYNNRHKIEGKVRLGVIPTIAGPLLSLVLKDLIVQYPDISLDVHEYTTDTIVRALKEGVLDIGILSTPLKDDSLEECILYYETFLLYGDKEKGKSFVVSETLHDKKWWLLEEGHCLRTQMLKICDLRKNKSVSDKIRFEANSFETILHMADHFGGMTLLPELYVRQLSAERKEKISRFEPPVPVREVSLVYFKPYAKTRVIEAVTALIKEKITPLLLSSEYHNKDLSIVGFN